MGKVITFHSFGWFIDSSAYQPKNEWISNIKVVHSVGLYIGSYGSTDSIDYYSYNLLLAYLTITRCKSAPFV